MKIIPYFLYLNFLLLLPFESRGMDEFLENKDEEERLQAFFRSSNTTEAVNAQQDPSTPPFCDPLEEGNEISPPKKQALLKRATTRRLIEVGEHPTNPARLSQDQIIENAKNGAELLTAQNGKQNYSSGASTKGLSFYISETSFEHKNLSLKEEQKTFSDMQKNLRNNAEEIDDEGFPLDDGSVVLDNYLFQEHNESQEDKETIKKNDDGFIKDKGGFLIPKAIKRPPVASKPFEQKTNQKKSTGQQVKRERAPDTKTNGNPHVPSPKRRKISQQPTPDQNPPRKPQGQRPTS